MASATSDGRMPLTLHRSEVHAQIEADAQETKVRQAVRRGRRGQMVRRGRVQFKDLGAPVDNAEIAKMTTMKIAKVDKERPKVGQNMGGTQHHEAARSGRNYSERAPEWASGTTDAKDGELGLLDEKQEKDLDTDQVQQPYAYLPHGLFGKDLLCCTGRDKATDGFRMLREFVRESENRVQQVKSMVPGTIYGLDYQVSMLDYLMPARKDYPPAVDRRQISARGSSTSSAAGQGNAPEEDEAVTAPASARAVLQSSPPDDASKPTAKDAGRPPVPAGPKPGSKRPNPLAIQSARESARKARHCPGRPEMPQTYSRQVYVSPVSSELRPRPLPIRLPSLANWIAKSEPAMGGRSERGENSHIREMINELLGLDREKVLKLPQEELGMQRRGRTDFKRKIEKQLDVAWENRSVLKKLITANPGANAEEGKGAEPDNRATGSADAPGATGAEEVAGGGHEGADRRRKREWTESEEAEAYAKFVALLREPDPTISPVARLRSTLHSYQESRDKHRGNLQSALYSMDADRLNSLRRRAAHLQPKSDGPTADAKSACALMRLEAERDMLQQHIQEKMKKQYLWYKELWQNVRGDKRDLPMVAHFIFDFVKQVLEYGEEFKKEMYFAMLEQIENFEFTDVIARVVVSMVKGIDGVSTNDLVEWFRKNRSHENPPVPASVEELTGRQDYTAKASTSELGDVDLAGETRASGKNVKGSSFITEVP
mmetsp:Transcript_143312/g.260777  ORF Transcript_143312/g.260777 Transcript_143312/m.260777 type:complete len:716 (+) Transcript_143312:193-2340(+)